MNVEMMVFLQLVKQSPWSYLRPFLCKMRLIFPRINGPNIKHCSFFESLMPEQNQNKPNYIEQKNQT